MKKIISLSLISASSLFADPALYTNQIVQILEDGTEQYLSDIPSSGNDIAPTIIVGKSVFELHTTHNTNNTSFLLDEKIVNGFNPKVSITINTQDPNVYQDGQRYTRTGKAYTVDYNLSGILPDSEVAAARAVNLEREQILTDVNDSKRTGFTNQMITQNGPMTISAHAHIGSFKEVKNIYSFYENVEASSSNTASTIESATVRIFTNAKGALLKCRDITDGNHEFGTPVESYREFPEIRIDVEDIYPGALVILRITANGSAPDPKNDIVIVTTGTSDTYTNTFDQTEVAEKLKNIDIEPTDTSVSYSAQLIERSVYGDVVLASAQFELHKAPIVINGELIGSE